MPASLMLRPNRPPRHQICRVCTSLKTASFSSSARRSVGLKYLAKQEAAEKAWQQQARRIKSGEQPCLWDIFEERGYVKDVAGTSQGIRELMRVKRIGAYVGIDPTAPSLHVGHLLPLMPIFWMYMHGYEAVTLIGGATAKVGDPSGRLKDREETEGFDIARNMTSLHYQLKRIWTNVEAQAKRYGYEYEWAWRRHLINNNRWWNKQPLLEFLQLLGKNIRVGPMLTRDTVKRKITEGDGLSFAELTYTLMQGWDFWELNKQLGIQMQVGGSDQYGNIVTGLDAVKIVRESMTKQFPEKFAAGFLNDPVGFTVPLLTNTAGEKIGKSSGGGNLWLDTFRTSAYDLYGYFVRQPDQDVERMLKLLTFIPTENIHALMQDHEADRKKRVAQHKLAYEVVTLVHGMEVAEHTQHEHKVLHGTGLEPVKFTHDVKTQLTPNSAAQGINIQLPKSLILNGNIARILYAAGLAHSVSEGNRLAVQKAIYIGGKSGKTAMDEGQLDFQPVALWFPEETKKFIINDNTLILRKGKHNVRIIELVDDQQYEASGQTYPGQPNTGRVRRLKEELKALKELQNMASDAEISIEPESKRIEEISESIHDQVLAAGERLNALRKQHEFFAANFNPKKHNPNSHPDKLKAKLGRLEKQYDQLKEAQAKLLNEPAEDGPQDPKDS